MICTVRIVIFLTNLFTTNAPKNAEAIADSKRKPCHRYKDTDILRKSAGIVKARFPRVTSSNLSFFLCDLCGEMLFSGLCNWKVNS
jgi:hypothetical protein